MTITSTTAAEEQQSAADATQEPESQEERSRIEAAAERIRVAYQGIEVVVSGLRSQRAMSDEQKGRVAELFDAEAGSVSVSSRLFDKDEPAIKSIRKAIRDVQDLFKDRGYTLPTAKPGRRLIRRDAIVNFNNKLAERTEALREAAEELRIALSQIKVRERERRGQAYHDEDYDFDPVTSCRVDVSFPSVDADQALATIDSGIYEQEIARARREMHDAVKRAEVELTEELYAMLDQLVSSLGTADDGTPKKFMNTTVTQIFEHLDHMSTQLRTNGIGGDVLQTASRRLRNVLSGYDADTAPDALRQSERFRARVQEQTAQIAENLLSSAVLQPRRHILMGNAANRRARRQRS